MLAYDAKVIANKVLSEQKRIEDLMNPVYEIILSHAKLGKYNCECHLNEEQREILSLNGYSVVCIETDLDGNFIDKVDWRNPK